MKKILMGVALLAMVGAFAVQSADAGRRAVVGPPLKWAKTSASVAGAYNYDSTRVSIPWAGLESANASAGSDTTAAFSIAGISLAGHTLAPDSTALQLLLGFRVDSWASDGVTWAASTDTSMAYTQFSYDMKNWTINAGSGSLTNAWFAIDHGAKATGIYLVPALYGLNRLATANALPPYWRVVVSNRGASATSKLVRWYEVRPVYWTND